MENPTLSLDQLLSQIEALPFGNEGAALIIFLFFIVLRTVFARLIMAFLRKLTLATPTTIDHELVTEIEGPIKFLFIVIGLSVCRSFLEIPEHWLAFSEQAITSLYTFTLFWALFNVVAPISRAVFTLGKTIGQKINSDIQHFAKRTLQVIIAIIAFVAVLEQWNINVSAFLGGLGLVGMAVALAAKDTVANLFGTLMIFTDRTYHKGDWIQTDKVEGTVEIIGLRATKIRTFAKALVNVPNADMANAPVINWSRMTHRRIKMTIGLEYRTTADQLEKIVVRLRDFIETDPQVEPKGPVAQMVHLVGFNASSIDINLYYFTKTTNWEEWRQIRNDHMIAFKKIVEEEGSAFAFPSRTVYLEQEAAPLDGPIG